MKGCERNNYLFLNFENGVINGEYKVIECLLIYIPPVGMKYYGKYFNILSKTHSNNKISQNSYLLQMNQKL